MELGGTGELDPFQTFEQKAFFSVSVVDVLPVVLEVLKTLGF